MAFLSELLLWHGRVEIKESEKDAPRPEVSKEATHDDGGKFVLGGLTKKRDMPQEIKFKLESNYFKGINCNVIVFPSVLRCVVFLCR